MLDPATGEVLALASESRTGPERPRAFIDAYEPGRWRRFSPPGP